MAQAINTYAIPILTYTFGLIKWTDTELDALNILIRTTSTKHRTHHKNSAIERFTLPRDEGGRGYIDIKNLHHNQMDNLRTYFYNKQNSNIHRAIITVDETYTPLKLKNNTIRPRDAIKNNNEKIESWKNKTLHGTHPYQINQRNIDKTLTNNWLTYANIYAETEGFMIAIQDRVIKTKNYAKYIIKDTTVTNDACRRCKTQKETIEHITGGCPTLAPTDYTARHDNVCKQIHIAIAKKHKLIDSPPPWYKYAPQAVLDNETHKLYWNRDIITDRTNLHNRPDITLIDKTNKHTYLIEISVPNTSNLDQKHTEKIQKYITLAEQIKNQWSQNNVTIVPIILSSTGVIPTNINNSLQILDLRRQIVTDIQKTVIINTCSIVRQFLQTPQ